jgi:hypothetical protein
MATRGTYRIAYNIVTRRDTYIYCHHDNYEIGAARRIKMTLELMDDLHKKYRRSKTTEFAECFIAANLSSTIVEITESHESHEDTNYSYDITIGETMEITAYEHLVENEKIKRKVIFSGYVSSFLETYLSDETINQWEKNEELIRISDILNGLKIT